MLPRLDLRPRDRSGRGDCGKRGERHCSTAAERGLERHDDAEDVEPRAQARTPLPARRLREEARERATRAKEQRLDGRLRERELLADLAIRQALPLSEEERAALLL